MSSTKVEFISDIVPCFLSSTQPSLNYPQETYVE
jgi:hypothetical protein